METRTIQLKDCNGTPTGRITIVGKESQKTTAFVEKYDTYEGIPYESQWYNTISPDDAFEWGYIDAPNAMCAEKNDLQVMLRWTKDAVDVREDPEILGFCSENF